MTDAYSQTAVNSILSEIASPRPPGQSDPSEPRPRRYRFALGEAVTETDVQEQRTRLQRILKSVRSVGLCTETDQTHLDETSGVQDHPSSTYLHDWRKDAREWWKPQKRFQWDAETVKPISLKRFVKPKRNSAKIRMWAGRGIVPPEHRKYFSLYLLGVASYILERIKRRGICEEFMAGIAHALGCSTKTVQRAIAVLDDLGYRVQRGAFDPKTRKTPATRISVVHENVWNWIKKAAGQLSPSKGIKDAFFLRPRPGKAQQRGDVNPTFDG